MTLPYTKVDPHSPIPLYHQIYLDIRQMIQNETIPPGGMLPPELEICQAYHVGRQTVRQAIARLVDENMLERFAGKGTFVCETQNLKQFFLDRSFSEQMRELGKTASSKVLSINFGVVSAKAQPPIAHLEGQPCMVLERLRMGDGKPVCHQTSTLLTENTPGIDEIDFNQASLYETLADRYHFLINRIDHVVRALPAGEYHSELLQAPLDSPLLFVGTSTFINKTDLIEYSTSYYGAYSFEFKTMQNYGE